MIELLVVIAIIAILAAILFPVFARARENARRSSCTSNLKQIGLGVLQYVQDYDERYPRAWFNSNDPTGGGFPGDYKWMDAIYPYVKSEQLFVCPSATNDNQKYAQRDASKFGSYGINSVYWDTGAVPANKRGPGNSGMNLSNIEAAATTVLAADGNGGFQMSWPRPNDQGGITGTGNNRVLSWQGIGNIGEGAMVERHLETTNVLYIDGHVKSGKLDALARQDANGYRVAFTPADD